MKLMGIDYGSKKVGVAVSDEVQSMAFPREVLPNTSDLVEALAKYIEREGIGEVIIGDSRNYQMEENPLMEEIYALKNALMERAGVEVHFEPEVLTSKHAEREQGRGSMNDASAAALILQSFMQRRHGFEL